MKTSNDVVLELMERKAQASDLEDCIAEIKDAMESPFYSDEFKLKCIRQTLLDYEL